MSPASSRLQSPLVVVLGCALTLLGVPALASAVPSPVSLGGPTGATNNATLVYTFSSVADPGYDIQYVGGLDGADGPIASPASYVVGDGPHTFHVKAVEVNPLTGDTSETAVVSASATVDTVAPFVAGALLPVKPNGQNNWYTSLVIHWTCTDAGSPGVSCPDQTWNTTGRMVPNGTSPFLPTPTKTVFDAAGNVSNTATVPAFNFDNLPPRAPSLVSPGSNALLVSEPTFSWSKVGDTSGVDHYEVWAKAGTSAARLVAVATPPALSATRMASAAPLPERTKILWAVRGVDVAGNQLPIFTSSASAPKPRAFTIDSSSPPPPTITAGPTGPTNVAAPAFSWSGAPGATSTWTLTPAGSDVPSQQGTGTATQTSLAASPDGDYTFRVSQITAAVPSADAERGFTIDTVAPGAPLVRTRPVSPSAGPPSFSWNMEQGALARWTVIGPTGATVQSGDTLAAAITIQGLVPGAYALRLVQFDAAGNASPEVSEPFVISGAAPPTTAGTGGKKILPVLPKQNAKRLRPSAGAVVATFRPILRWTAGPRHTSVYSVQVFRVTRLAGGRTVRLTKVFVAFPKGTRVRMPAATVKAGACFVWRVWPFMDKTYTKTPLGVSNFCVSPKISRKGA